MTDLAGAHAAWLATYVRRTRNFTPLTDWLKGGGYIDEPIRRLLTDIVAGDLKASTKKATRTSSALPSLLRGEVDFWKAELRGHVQDGGKISVPWEEVEPLLKLAGYEGTPETLGQCSAAARKITGWLNRLSTSQLDELLHPRASRPRRQQA